MMRTVLFYCVVFALAGLITLYSRHAHAKVDLQECAASGHDCGFDSYEPGRYAVFGYTETMYHSGQVIRIWTPPMAAPNRKYCKDLADSLNQGNITVPKNIGTGVTFGFYMCMEHNQEWQPVRP